jgi:hypothetical protein
MGKRVGAGRVCFKSGWRWGDHGKKGWFRPPQVNCVRNFYRFLPSRRHDRSPTISTMAKHTYIENKNYQTEKKKELSTFKIRYICTGLLVCPLSNIAEHFNIFCGISGDSVRARSGIFLIFLQPPLTPPPLSSFFVQQVH